MIMEIADNASVTLEAINDLLGGNFNHTNAVFLIGEEKATRRMPADSRLGQLVRHHTVDDKNLADF